MFPFDLSPLNVFKRLINKALLLKIEKKNKKNLEMPHTRISFNFFNSIIFMDIYPTKYIFTNA